MDGGAWWAAVHGVAKSQTRVSDFTFTFHFHALEKEMAIHSSVLAWRIPGTGEPGGLPSMGSHRVGHDWSDLAAAAAVSRIHRVLTTQHQNDKITQLKHRAMERLLTRGFFLSSVLDGGDGGTKYWKPLTCTLLKRWVLQCVNYISIFVNIERKYQ